MLPKDNVDEPKNKDELEVDDTVNETPEEPSLPESSDGKAESVAEAPVSNVQNKEELFAPDAPVQTKTGGKFKQFLYAVKDNKKVSIPLVILLLLVVIMAVPFTRYKVLGLVIKQSVEIVVKDSQTNQPITEASVSVAGKNAPTDSNGIARLTKVPVGPQKITVTKKYYKDAQSSVTASLKKQAAPFEIKLEATGRQIPVKVTNKITGSPAENVLIEAADVQARTDKDGKATLVVPVDKQKVSLKLTGSGYNQLDTEIEVSKAVDTPPTFEVVSAGKIYFLSKLSGKVDVVKTNLDGSERKVVLAGTGKEDTTDTILLASRDWKYLALKSKRDGADAKLFLIETSNDKLTTMDEGDASFSLNGWSGHQFIYTVTRNKLKEWDNKQIALKSYSAGTKQIVTLDETRGLGTSSFDYAYESLNNVYVFEDKVVYAKIWNQNNNFSDLANRKSTIVSISSTGQNKTTVKEVQVSEADYISYINAKLYTPDELYFQVHFRSQKPEFWEYENGKIKIATNVDGNTFNKAYPTFLLSPSGKLNFWHEPRDGKNTLFVGDEHGKNEKEIAALSEYIPYGWYSDEYVLVSKNSSELYIMPKTGVKEGSKIQKVTDYHKPSADFTGYGGGYGGF